LQAAIVNGEGDSFNFENGLISKFEGLVTLTLTLDRVTAYRCASRIDLYIRAKFHWNRRNFCGGRTDGRTYART